MNLRRNATLCHGCRACELMCSFHHHRRFWPEHASIHVVRDNANGGIRWSLDGSCDLCRGEPGMYCVKYCPYGALEKTIDE